MKLLDELRTAIRVRHYSRTTEQTYVGWIKRYLHFHAADGLWRHPREMGAPEVEPFLTHLAVARRVAASTQAPPLRSMKPVPSCRNARSPPSSVTHIAPAIRPVLLNGVRGPTG